MYGKVAQNQRETSTTTNLDNQRLFRVASCRKPGSKRPTAEWV